VWADERVGVWAYGRVGVWAYGRVGVGALLCHEGVVGNATNGIRLLPQARDYGATGSL
jgi:hypothetical protein